MQIPSKVIWYFPPIPQFKRLYKTIECAKNLTWHASERIKDDKLYATKKTWLGMLVKEYAKNFTFIFLFLQVSIGFLAQYLIKHMLGFVVSMVHSNYFYSLS